MTVFVRLLDVDAEEKPHRLLQAVSRMNSGEAIGSDVYVSAPAAFGLVDRSPFAYWVSDDIRLLFSKQAPLESNGRIARAGLVTGDDERWLRLWWEPAASRLSDRTFVPFVKGGIFSPVYADVGLTLRWDNRGRWIKEWKLDQLRQGLITANNSKCWNESQYFRPGLTWPARTQSGLAMRALPAGGIFAGKGPTVFVATDSSPDLLSLLAVTTSSPFRFLVDVQMAFGSYEVGVIQRTPVPRLTPDDTQTLANLARRAWSLKRSLDTTNEISHAFLLPKPLNTIDRSTVDRELQAIAKQIDEVVVRLYGIGVEDRTAIESPTSASANDASDANESGQDRDDGIDEEIDVALGPDQFGSWLVGVAFGRFDPRLATGGRAIPPEPEPFDPLPARSPGMYPPGEEPVDRPDILVDDEGHSDDLAARAIAVAERVKVDAPENLRAWLVEEFFPLHIKMYSKSRRKAPIYWQLATHSAGYSVWLYIHAFSKDTLFRVQNDYVAPKLAHEERRLESLTGELRDGATATQRKQLAAQQALVDELRAFLDEVKRVAPLWKPDLDDGVVINFAPLWRLVPQNKSWQKELRSTWDALCEGKYDWAHLAMHLWPERVVPQCAKDRSLAIAHGLEGLFWVEGTDGKWTARKAPTRSVDELVRERNSPAVKSALQSLLEAPAANNTSKKSNKGTSHA